MENKKKEMFKINEINKNEKKKKNETCLLFEKFINLCYLCCCCLNLFSLLKTKKNKIKKQ